ncbi:MauE/DoxX family redox-associated membrane protein [Mycolicibacterium sp. P1-5]|jgi:uncharacterized membrane protein|uniref:DoxX family protein n=1 Tax=Mycolicibacterium sp. P1-5 TaxID=2024617 RepID=UPI0011EF63EB|nr:MauE/DoxX family redox-associated membrane protein [Mycolicibacterium sp. P1-5]KAA0102580.1 hypothetical protein CIW47_24440 [Mycolicibacterium sp. P1-5]
MPTTTTELEPTRSASQLPAYRTALMLIGIGVGHFLAPKPFDDIVPAELPGDARFYTYASGVAEVGIGTMLLVPRTRRAGAAFAIALFLAVFPANVNMVRLWKDKPLPLKLVALARLPLQVPMIIQALAIRRNAPRY